MCEKKIPQQRKGVIESAKWHKYHFESPPAGRVVIYWSCRDSDIPVRDVTNSQKGGHTLEPNFETRTYNLHAACNQDKVFQACLCRERYLFFATKYVGGIAGLQGKLILTGYYTIDETLWTSQRVAIRSREPYFLNPKTPLFVADVWKLLYKASSPVNLRHVKVLLDETQTAQVLQLFHSRANVFAAYVAEARRLKKSLARLT